MDIKLITNKKLINTLEDNHKKQIQMIQDQHKSDVKKLQDRSIQIQQALVKDILTLQETVTSYRGNTYQSYEEAVDAINDKYQGTADWGVLQTGIIINLRSVFIMGEGVKISHTTKTKKQAQKELDWIDDFFEYNYLDPGGFLGYAREAEIEGKIAFKFIYDDDLYKDYPGMVSTRYVSWYSKKYEIIPNPDDYLDYQKMKWSDAKKDNAEVKLKQNQFTYRKFSGRVNDPNDAYPTTARCLTQIEDVDKGLRDWREINHLFASPTPDFKMETWKEVDAILKLINDKNWKIKKLIAHTGEFKMIGPDMSGIDSLEREILIKAKLISGATGVPVHFLGLLDLLKSKATGESVREVLNAATTQERMTWESAVKEIIRKSMEMYNEKAQGQKSTSVKLDPDKIKVDIPVITQEHWDRIEKVLIPAAAHGIITKEYVASQIPGLDTEEEEARKEENDAKETERLQLEIDRMREEQKNNEDEEIGNEGNLQQ